MLKNIEVMFKLYFGFGMYIKENFLKEYIEVVDFIIFKIRFVICLKWF